MTAQGGTASGRRRNRLDVLLVDRGLLTSRDQARRAIMAGQVHADGKRVDKAGTLIAIDAVLTVQPLAREPFASRAGRKLAQALDHFGLDPRGLRCLDVGASTGGFTDCLLQRGAHQVVALDVGYGQLEQRLREDSRVVVVERVNARNLSPDYFPEPFDLVTVDVSFISLLKIVPSLVPFMRAGSSLVTLIKPQFEVGRGEVGKGGVVRDEAIRRRIIDLRAEEIAACGFIHMGTLDSDTLGDKGNREALSLFRRAPVLADQGDTQGLGS